MPKILLGPEQLATMTAPGLMSAADKNKLDTVASDSSGNEYIKGTLYVNCDSSFDNGTSVVKATDYATTEDAGVIKIGGGLFIDNLTHKVSPEKANDNQIKAGSAQYRPIVPEIQHKSVFYGLAKAAGDNTQSASSNAVGVYTDEAKSAIQNMLGIAPTTDAEKLDKSYEIDFKPCLIKGIPTDFESSYIWTDGENIYYSNSSNQYVLNKSTSTWVIKNWTGLTDFVGNCIWTDGENIYYSAGTRHYVLDKSTLSWSSKTWSGMTNFSGKYIWTDGENVYYSDTTLQRVLDKSTSTWSTKTWDGLTSIDGRYIWSDGENIYYSSSLTQYILDKSTLTWTSKTWNGYSNIQGTDIWLDGENVYYSTSNVQYVLDKSTSTWSSKTWSGLNNVRGDYIWTDGNNIFYSYGLYQYVLDRSTSTWSIKTWTGLTSFDGGYVWTDGENIYYSYSSTHYVFDKSTLTWSSKTWSGLTNFYGGYIWTDGENIYYSSSSTHYILDKSTSTWSTKTWTGLTSFDGANIWTDENNIYYSNGSNQYVLDKSTSTWSTKTWAGLTSFVGQYIWTDGTNIYYGGGFSNHYVLDKSTSTWSRKTWSGFTNFYGNAVWTDGDNIYYSTTSAQYVLDKSTSTWFVKKWTELTNFNGTKIWSDGDNIYYGISYKLLDSKPKILLSDNCEFNPTSPDSLTMSGATNLSAGSIGFVPAPAAGDQNKYLKGDGTWSEANALPGVTTADNGKILLVDAGAWTASTILLPTKVSDLTNDSGYLTSVPVMTGATSSAAGTAGLVPAPAQYDNTKYLRGDGTWSLANASYLGGIYFDRYSYSGGLTTDYGYLLYQDNPLTDNNAKFMRIQVTPVPTVGKVPTYGTGACLNSTTPSANDNSTKVATTAYVDRALSNFTGGGGLTGVTLVSTSLTPDSNGVVTIPAMTGATSSTAGAAGLVPAPTTGDVDKFLAGDGTYKSGGLPMVILSYGNSTWSDFINAYNNNVIVYCRASSNSNPASGSQTRMAFMAYVNNATTPTNVEFQYYRSVNTHSATQMGDQVFIYKLDKTSGWSVTTREASIKEINVASGSKLGVSWGSNKVTLSNTMTADDMPMSSSDATTTKSAIDSLNNNITNMGKIKFFPISTATTSVTLNLPSSSTHFIIIGTNNRTIYAILMVVVVANDAVQVTTISKGENVTIDSSVAGKLTVTFDAARQAGIYDMAIRGENVTI